jgi:hypothetical protein
MNINSGKLVRIGEDVHTKVKNHLFALPKKNTIRDFVEEAILEKLDIKHPIERLILNRVGKRDFDKYFSNEEMRGVLCDFLSLCLPDEKTFRLLIYICTAKDKSLSELNKLLADTYEDVYLEKE